MAKEESAAPTYRIGFVGAGNMATALARGILAAGLATADQLAASDPSPERRHAFREATGATVLSGNASLVRGSRMVVLAVKPQVSEAVLTEIGPLLKHAQLVVSIVAGLSVGRIESFLTGPVPVLRVMPNTPALVRRGMSALAPGTHARPEHLEEVRKLLRAVGEVVTVPEEAMDAVTAVSGSGPAYFFYFIEALAAAGIGEGLAPEVAWTLARQTALGAAELACRSAEPVEKLRVQVTSPGGTTEAAIRTFAEGGFKEIVLRAVQAAAKRSRELGK